jgi:hypothetical protein
MAKKYTFSGMPIPPIFVPSTSGNQTRFIDLPCTLYLFYLCVIRIGFYGFSEVINYGLGYFIIYRRRLSGNPESRFTFVRDPGHLK